MKEKKKKHIVEALIVLIVYAGIFLGLKFLIPSIFPNLKDVIKEIIILLILILILLLYLSYTRQLDIFKSKSNFIKGLKIGLPVIIFFGMFLISNISLNVEKGNELTATSDIILNIIFCLLVGISEEILFRGIILNKLFKAIGNDTRKNVLKAVIISAILFGLVHLTNVIYMDATFVVAITQFFVASGTGLIYGAIYSRTKNIYSTIIIHSFQDFCAWTMTNLFINNSSTDSPQNSEIFFGIFVLVLSISLFSFMMRKKKSNEYVLN